MPSKPADQQQELEGGSLYGNEASLCEDSSASAESGIRCDLYTLINTVATSTRNR